jgi:hypothetical protein
MSCFDWPRLLEHRFDGDVDTPPEWAQARLHMESCADCRREVADLDPTLIFRHAAAWSADPAELEAVRQAVRALRRAGALSASVAAGRSVSRERRVSAMLFGLVLALIPGRMAHRDVDAGGSALVVSAVGALRSAGPGAPAIEGVDRPHARVYEWAGDDLSVVMVVDESLDV